MRQAKKWLALFLAIVMIFSMTACGKEKQNVSGTVTKSDGEKTISGTVQPEEKSEDKPVEEAPEPEPEEEKAPEEETTAPEEETTAPEESENPEASEDDTIDIGSVVGGTYENTYLGIGCTLDSNWTYANAEELAELNEVSIESFTNEELKEAMENSDSFFDMYAYSTDGMALLQIVFENLGVLYGTILDENAYVEILSGTIEESYEDLGATDISFESTTQNLWGAERPVLSISCTIDGIAVYQKMTVIKAGSHMANVSVNSYTADITDTLLDLFYALP